MGDDHSYGVAVRQRTEDLKQTRESLNTCDQGNYKDYNKDA